MKIDLVASTVVGPGGFAVRLAKIAEVVNSHLDMGWGQAREFYVDQAGKLIRVSHEGEKTTEMDVGPTADLIAALQADPSFVDALRTRISEECGSRILTVLKDQPTQANINSYLLDLLLATSTGQSLTVEQEADIAMAQALKAWVEAMQAASRQLKDASSISYSDETNWPAAPEGGREFCDRF